MPARLNCMRGSPPSSAFPGSPAKATHALQRCHHNNEDKLATWQHNAQPDARRLPRRAAARARHPGLHLSTQGDTGKEAFPALMVRAASFEGDPSVLNAWRVGGSRRILPPESKAGCILTQKDRGRGRQRPPGAIGMENGSLAEEHTESSLGNLRKNTEHPQFAGEKSTPEPHLPSLTSTAPRTPPPKKKKYVTGTGFLELDSPTALSLSLSLALTKLLPWLGWGVVVDSGPLAIAGVLDGAFANSAGDLATRHWLHSDICQEKEGTLSMLASARQCYFPAWRLSGLQPSPQVCAHLRLVVNWHGCRMSAPPEAAPAESPSPLAGHQLTQQKGPQELPAQGGLCLDQDGLREFLACSVALTLAQQPCLERLPQN